MATRRFPFFAVLFYTTTLTIGISAIAADPANDNDAVAAAVVSDRYLVADGIHHGKLTLYPIIDQQVKPRPEGDFELLGAAMGAGTLTITEIDASGTVANLKVHNTGSKPVLLMAGDVITGGKQDRIVTEDIVLDNGTKPIDIAVNCVESGRWQANSERFSYGGKAEVDLKQTVELEKDQSATWSKVSELNEKKAVKFAENAGVLGALAPSTGTYNASLSTPAVVAERDAIVKGLLPSLDKQKNVVGLVVAIGDDVVAGEIFGHPALFEKGEADLLNALALDSVSSDNKGAAPKTSEAAEFLEDVLEARTTRTEQLANADRTDFEDDEVEGSALRAKPAAPSEQGEIIHLNSYKKK